MYRRDFDSHCDWAPSKVLLESKNFLRPGDFFLSLAEAAAEPANLQNQMAQKLSQSSPLSTPYTLPAMHLFTSFVNGLNGAP